MFVCTCAHVIVKCASTCSNGIVIKSQGVLCTCKTQLLLVAFWGGVGWGGARVMIVITCGWEGVPQNFGYDPLKLFALYSTARAYGNLHSRVRAVSQFPHSRVFFSEYS